MYSIRVIGTEKYLASTPYTAEESKNDGLTTNVERAAKYHLKGYAEKLRVQFPEDNFEIVTAPDSYMVTRPDGSVITMEAYLKSDDYHDRLQQNINEFMTNEKEEELIALFKK